MLLFIIVYLKNFQISSKFLFYLKGMLASKSVYFLTNYYETLYMTYVKLDYKFKK